MSRQRVVRERLAPRGPVDLHRTAGFLHRGAGDVRFTDDGLRAAVRAGGGLALVELSPAGPEIDVLLRLQPGASTEAALAAARQLAGLPRDASRPDPHAAFAKAARQDAALAPVLRACRGLRLPQRPDATGTIVGAILAQQVTGSFAAELARRVGERWGETVTLGGESWRLPPRAEVLAEVSPAEMRPLQVSTRKAEYIRDLSREIADGALDLHALASLGAEEATAELVRRRGIGPTTAAWLLSFGAGHPDAWPPADVGLWRALERLHGTRDGRKVRRWLDGYAGTRSLLAVHLWEGLRLKIISA